MSTIAELPPTFGPFIDRMRERAKKRAPVTAGLELTFRCNLACVHCYVNQPANDREEKARELTTDEWFRVIDQSVDAGVLWMTLTGGEPLLRPDFCDIYEYAHERGMVLSVYSNATLITERHLEMWTRRPPRTIEVTQYGWTRETYDKVTDAGTQYDRFQRGLQRLRAAGIDVTLKAIAMRASVHELMQIRDFAKREGMQFRYDAVISPRIDGGRGPLAQRLTPAEVAAIENADGARATEFAEYCSRGVEASGNDSLYQCGAGLNSIVVDPYGKMHVCQLSRRPGWDVLRDGLQRGFDEAFGKLREEKRHDTAGCATCPTGRACSNCVGMATLEGRSTDFGDEYFCNTTDARMAAMYGDARPTPNGLVQLRVRREHG
jgi:radical SAM protein with 4Fe4S-binding SPASM domain